MFACTDGLTEARREGRQFGDERLAGLLAEHGARARRRTRSCSLLHREAEAWAPALDDDMVILALRRRRVIEVRHEPPDGPAAQALFDEYMALVARARRARLRRRPSSIFATADVFRGPGSAWLVLYDDGEPVACAGLRAARRPAPARSSACS